ncbi:hypothetical protein [Leekyejoonella antrihumi]|uniref:Uncharacterized protein n=1 Tax=Leekyejoonella antrihumi TaxID=1660198 RepID=A0A563E1W2_9MICO|nr:hypothetical protein [Leekyejoonella antrihumi]TWP35894.1 hypothetical protein FGL98_11700 [Leekyejoonella antrihumi]
MQCLCDGTELPVSVHALFEATLGRLAPAERAFCEGASILGREFYVEAVEPVIGAMCERPRHGSGSPTGCVSSTSSNRPTVTVPA